MSRKDCGSCAAIEQISRGYCADTNSLACEGVKRILHYQLVLALSCYSACAIQWLSVVSGAGRSIPATRRHGQQTV